MPDQSTLPRALLRISEMLAPLSTMFAPDRAVGSFAELGITLTPAQASSLGAPVQAMSAAVAGLLEDAANLTIAIDADDIGAIAAKAASAIGKTISSIDAIDSLQSAASGLGIPDAAQLAERLFNMLLVRALDELQGVAEALEFIGVIEHSLVAVGPDQHRVSAFNFGTLGGWLSSPVAALQTEYGWNGGAFEAAKLLGRLETLLAGLNVPVYFDPALPDPALDFVFFQLKPQGSGLVLTTRQSLSPGSISVAVDDFTLGFDMAATLPFGLQIAIQPPATFSVAAGGGGISGNFALTMAADRTGAAEKYVLIGEAGGSRLEFGKFGAAIGLGIAPDGRVLPSLRGDIGEGKLFVSFAEADGFLGTILGGVELNSDFDLGFGYAGNEGLFFEGSASLEIELPLHISLGPVDLSALTLSVGIDGDTFPATFAVTIRAALGPLVAVVEDVGLRADFKLTDNRDGNAGPIDISLGFKPPNGVGLSVDAGVVKGGGYLYIDAERGEYAGALELSLLEFLTVNAVAVITTRMPDGSDGFSLVAVIGVEFNPGFQLGFGFTLLGVGGLIGLNRTMNLDALAAGVRTGAINSVVFPTDVVANAPRIISDMKAFFPPAQGIFLIGPMMKVGWGTPTLISLALGVIIEIPGNIAIVGTVKVALPAEEAALIVIQVAFIGALEFDKKRGWFFASLYDSRIIFMPLEGGIGVLVDFGDNPNFVLSVGGFHPSYNPPALPFPAIARLAINIYNTPVARVRVTCYFAVTSNTVQFGAKVEVYFGIGIASIDGHLAFDALFQFSPFYFIITISASLSVKLFGAGLFSVRFRGSLEGPAPWHIEGTGSISLLFWDVDVDFEHTWGETDKETLPPIALMPLLAAEFAKIENWTAALPSSSNLLVSLRDIDAGVELVLHPLGSLTISQRALPLTLTLDKMGARKPSDANNFSIDIASAALAKRGETQESFAMAQFKTMSDAEKLSASDYEREESGLVLGAAGEQTRSSFVTKRIVRYEESIIDRPFQTLVLHFVQIVSGLFTHLLGKNAVALSPLSARTATEFQPFDDKIAVKPAGYTVALTMDNSPLAGAQFFASRAKAQQFLATAVNENPGLAGQCHVIRPQDMKQAA